MNNKAIKQQIVLYKCIFKTCWFWSRFFLSINWDMKVRLIKIQQIMKIEYSSFFIFSGPH